MLDFSLSHTNIAPESVFDSLQKRKLLNVMKHNFAVSYDTCTS